MGPALLQPQNGSGQLGDGTNDTHPLPVQVEQAAGVAFTSVVSGGYFSCALTAAGKAYCWGLNVQGQLGNNHGSTGLMPVAQPDEAVRALRAAVAAHPPLELAALGVAVPALGSLVLGLAVADGALDGTEAMRLAVLDETFQEEFWGTDAEALDRRARVSADVALAGRLFLLARDIAA